MSVTGGGAATGGPYLRRPQPDDTASLELPEGTQAPSVARRFVLGQAAGLAEDLVRDALLLVSELVTNAVCHGEPAVTLHVTIRPAGIKITVTDRGPRAVPIELGRWPSGTESGGRGLRLVDALASSWGVESLPSAPGKSVWFAIGPGPVNFDAV